MFYDGSGVNNISLDGYNFGNPAALLVEQLNENLQTPVNPSPVNPVIVPYENPVRQNPLPAECNCVSGTPVIDANGVCTCVDSPPVSGGVKPIKDTIPNYTRKIENGIEYFYHSGKWHINRTYGISPVNPTSPTPVIVEQAQSAEGGLFGLSPTTLLIGAAAIGGILYFSSGKEKGSK